MTEPITTAAVASSAPQVAAGVAGSAAISALVIAIGPAYTEVGLAAAGGFVGAMLAVTVNFSRQDQWDAWRVMVLAAHVIVPVIVSMCTAATLSYALALWFKLGTENAVVSPFIFFTALAIGRYTTAPQDAAAPIKWALDVLDRFKGSSRG
jgi:hypothetical protein